MESSLYPGTRSHGSRLVVPPGMHQASVPTFKVVVIEVPMPIVMEKRDLVHIRIAEYLATDWKAARRTAADAVHECGC